MYYLKPLSTTLAALSLSFAANTLALEPANQKLSYSNVEVGFQKMTGDGSFDGFVLRGSYLFTPNIYVKGEFNNLEADFITQEGLSIVAGFATALNPTLDVYAEAGLANYEVTVDIPGFGKFSEDETGLQIEGGVRTLLAEKIEAQGYFRHLMVDSNDESFLGVKGAYNVTPMFAAFADASYLLDASEFLLQIGARVNF